jgi:3-hydroxyacyl-CoA dehydrogenase
MTTTDSPQSRAERHLAAAERKTAQVPGVSEDTPTRHITTVGIIGAGTMGGGIAMNFANVGIPVTLLEQKQEALDNGLAVIRHNYEASAAKGKLTAEQVEERMGLLQGSLSYEDLANADLVIEAVFEKMSVKRAVFTELDRVCKPGAILASNTSTLDLNEIAATTQRPQDVIGLHFFSPANVMKLLEVVRGEQTSAEVIATCMQLARSIRKVPVLVGVCFGFVGNRMIEPYGREANRLFLEGSSPAKVDKVLMDFGFPMGPFTMGDMAGLDIGYSVRESRREHIGQDPSYCVVADRMVEAGRVGLKVGAGVYRYEKGDRRPHEDPEAEAVAQAEAERLDVTRSEHSDQEILERCLFPLINEGAQILEEGIASRPSDIDVIYVYGYGFPPFRGGPMQYADEIGLEEVYNALCHYRDTLGDYGRLWFQPAPLLERLVKEGRQFSDLNN